jgi:hypothetical protein
VAPTLGECLVYPLADGPGLGLLVLLPPILWVWSLPIFDIIAHLEPIAKKDWALGLLVVPVLVPVIFSFSMTFGYALLFLGHVLVSSSLGEIDHPRWPEWHPADISEGICRWFWAAFFGIALGGVPAAYYWLSFGGRDWGDWLVFALLAILGAGYAQMALPDRGSSPGRGGPRDRGPLVQDAQDVDGGDCTLGVLGCRPLHGNGRAAHDGTDVPRPCA